jgi:nitrate reductase (cytochrome)
VKDGKVVGHPGRPTRRGEQGLLCVKGYHVGLALYGKDRLTTPQLRRNGKLEPISWDEAIDVIAKRIMAAPENSRSTAAVNGPFPRAARATSS